MLKFTFSSLHLVSSWLVMVWLARHCIRYCTVSRAPQVSHSPSRCRRILCMYEFRKHFRNRMRVSVFSISLSLCLNSLAFETVGSIVWYSRPAVSSSHRFCGFCLDVFLREAFQFRHFWIDVYFDFIPGCGWLGEGVCSVIPFVSHVAGHPAELDLYAIFYCRRNRGFNVGNLD